MKHNFATIFITGIIPKASSVSSTGFVLFPFFFFFQQRNTTSTVSGMWTQKTSVLRKYNHLSNAVIYMHFTAPAIENHPTRGLKYNQSLV